MRRFGAALLDEDVILAEGSVIELLRRRGALPGGRTLASSLALDEEGRRVLAGIFRSYIDVAEKAGLPIVVLAPTWKAGSWECGKDGLDMRRVNRACVDLMKELVSGYPGMEGRIFIGGLVGSRGDAYRPGEGLPRNESERYHAPQIGVLMESGVEFVLASTIPSIGEAEGIAAAAAGAKAPLVVSYVARNDGKVLDGTFLGEAVERVDGMTGDPPLFQMANCIHPANLARALGRDENAPLVQSGRLIGIQANASMLDPDELDGREELDADDPVRWAGAMAALRAEFGIKVLGGCCGTDDRYIGRLASFLTDNQ
jgi:homocysteine S-methyltransferase